MKKYKLTPQEYRQILSKVDLDDITLIELKTKYSEGSIKEDIDISIKETSKNLIEDNTLKIYMLCVFMAKNKTTNEEIIKISVRYRVDFIIEGESSDISDEFIKILTDNTVKITIWPYFRQELQSIMSKMNLPQIVLPLKRR